MNIKALRKSYDALQPPERYAAIMAAVARNDESERRALADSTPTKIFRVANTYGLEEAWRFNAGFYVLSQMADIASVFIVMHFSFGEDEAKAEEADRAITVALTRFLARAQAWRELCEESQIDPAPVLAPYPGYDVLEIFQAILPVMFQARTGESEPPRAAVDIELESMRDVIAHFRQDWE